MKTKKTRSDLIREHLSSLPSHRRSPTAVAKALKAKGLNVTRNHVSVVKTHMSRGRASSSTRDLILAKRFLDAVGSPAKARRLITVIGKIVRG